MNDRTTIWLHRLAVATACVALLPIVMGALVTTINAGMAFSDWPTSDGHNMFTYAWSKSTGDKFVEHGHRLAGTLVGLFSIALAGALWWKEPRRWVRILGTLVLLGVIIQGILGGARVLSDSRTMAMVHGQFGSWVFTLMGCVALFTSRSWLEAERMPSQWRLGPLKVMALVTLVSIVAQLLLGGMLRHQKTVLFEHLGFAFVVVALVIATFVLAMRTGSRWIRRSAALLLGLIGMQASLGAGAWVTTFGFATLGYVAVENSLSQTLFATAHAVLAMLVLMTSVILVLRVYRVAALQPATEPQAAFSRPVIVRGGVG